MKLIGNFIFHIFSNTIALYAAFYYIPGFHFEGDFVAAIIAAGILTLINMFLRPILKLFFGPLIVITFGLFTIVINAITLLILDKLSTPLTIEGYVPLLWGALLIGVVNLIVGFSAKALYHKNDSH
jgi:putative membrane protein